MGRVNDPQGVRFVCGAAAVGLAVVLLDLLCTAGGALATEDLFWHLATGRELWAGGGSPTGDPFAFTTERPWALHEWAFEILVAGVYGASGGWGLRLLGLVGWAGVFAALAWGTRRVTRDHAAWLLTLGLACVLLRHRVQLRPQLFSVLGIALLLPALGDPRWRWSRTRLIVLGVGVALWINLHSVALLAPVMLGAAAFGELCARNGRWKPAGLAAAIAGAATLVSPQPLGPWRYALSARDPVLAFVTDEWTPLWTGPGAGLSLFGYAAVCAVGGLWLAGLLLPLTSAPRETPADAAPELSGWNARWPALLTFAAAIPARRFAWLTLLPAADGARRLAARCTGTMRWAPALLALAAAALAVADSAASWHARFTGPSAGADSVAAKFPIAAADLLARAEVSGQCYTDYGDAGYLLWRCAPRIQVFVDGRTLQYDAQVLSDFLHIRDNGLGREALLERYGTDVVLATRGFQGTLSPKRWRLVYRDAQSILWVRNDRPAVIRALEAAQR